MCKEERTEKVISPSSFHSLPSFFAQFLVFALIASLTLPKEWKERGKRREERGERRGEEREEIGERREEREERREN